MGLDLALFFSAVKMTTMANATVIGALQFVGMGVVLAAVGLLVARPDAARGFGRAPQAEAPDTTPTGARAAATP